MLIWLRERQFREMDDNVMVVHVFPGQLVLNLIIRLVAAYDKVNPTILTTVKKGPKNGLLARNVAIYLCQQIGGYGLADSRTHVDCRLWGP